MPWCMYVHQHHTVVRSYSQDVPSRGLKGVTCDYKLIWSINQYIRMKLYCSLVMRWDTVVIDNAATWQPCPGWCNASTHVVIDRAATWQPYPGWCNVLTQMWILDWRIWSDHESSWSNLATSWSDHDCWLLIMRVGGLIKRIHCLNMRVHGLILRLHGSIMRVR